MARVVPKHLGHNFCDLLYLPEQTLCPNVTKFILDPNSSISIFSLEIVEIRKKFFS